ncbi:MAG TPA: zf-HC2 domain-containing protein [Streptosporangiaceae bacterium]|nr:zf-HC2 domain-containing protein [Streptosporangiaceae bacterium]
MSHLGQRISALIDGELSDAERDRVLAHIAGCDECRQEAVALRALKRRMHSLGEAMVDAALTGRLMAMAMPSDGRPWTARAPWRTRGAFPAARMLTAGLLASTVAGLGAAAFFAGGEQQAPGPKVTPAVDTFLVQHAIVTGDLPVTSLAGGAASTPSSPAPAAGSSPAPAAGSSHVVAGGAVSGIAAAAAAGAQARSAVRRFARGQASSGQASVGQVASGQVTSGQLRSSQVGSMMRRALQLPVDVASSPVPLAAASASPGP